MSVEYIRYVLKDHTPDEPVSAYVEAARHLEAAPDCDGHDLTQCEEEPPSFILRIQWQSTPAHLEGFRKGPHFPPFLAAIKPFIPEIAEMRHYQPTVVARAKPA